MIFKYANKAKGSHTANSYSIAFLFDNQFMNELCSQNEPQCDNGTETSSRPLCQL